MLITPATINSTSATPSTFATLLISELSPSIDQVNNKNEATLINPIQIAIGWYSLRNYGGRYWDRTSDPFHVKEVRYRCANRP